MFTDSFFCNSTVHRLALGRVHEMQQNVFCTLTCSIGVIPAIRFLIHHSDLRVNPRPVYDQIICANLFSQRYQTKTATEP